MKLTEIAVKKLFGVFDHQIPLTNTGITIVIGENGLGKTVILEAVNAFFGENYGFFKDLDFNVFTFYFDTDEYWELTKRVKKDEVSLLITKKHRKNVNESVNFTAAKFDNSGDLIRPKNRARLRNMQLEYEIEYEHYLRKMIHSSDRLDYLIDQDTLHHIRRDFMNKRIIDVSDRPPPWFIEVYEKIKVKLIETQRIITTAKANKGEPYIRAVKKSSDELREQISKIEKSASTIATNLDSTYPNRLIAKLQQQNNVSLKELNDALQNLDVRRKLLFSTGIMISTQDSNLFQVSKGDEKGLINILKLYIDDSNEKLAPYDDISHQIELFLSIVNKRFKHKKLEISKTEGFVFKSTIKKDEEGNNVIIPPSSLSSGEQHELILFYELIFKSNSGDMILIDEPELSLHISWQNQFIKDLKAVTSLNDVSIIIATHSPDIIDENWDLRVELLGIE